MINALTRGRRKNPPPEQPLYGFSFGGSVAIKAASLHDVSRLITVAPAVERVSVDTSRLPACPWLVIQGDRDDVVDPANVKRWTEGLSVAPDMRILEGAGHFFHGRMNDLRQLVVQWMGTKPA